ncbi:hypothetical protein [Mucilaginibacter sp. dw_454]|uniref:hypothetical protein n=1 Tax=Mucilaginibacter sp. dw_454 TaxID=2720079 RepID=UPI001BD5C25A|nr:hypothetical protein [Mucilaginibacter sp. dw_454]
MEVNTIIKAQHSSYQTRADEYNNLWVLNTANILTYAHPKTVKYKFDDPFEFDAVAKAFNQAFGLERLQELEDNKDLHSITYWISTEGKILEIEFVTSVDTGLSIEELEALESALKSTVCFRLTWLDNEKAEFVSKNTSVSFEGIITRLRAPAGSVHTKVISVVLTPPTPFGLK